MRRRVRRFYAGLLSEHASQVNRSPRVLKCYQWYAMANKHPANRTAGPVMAQIGGNGFSHLDRQGHEDGLTALAPNGYLALLPIDVLQVQSDHLAGPEPQPCKQKEDRVVPPGDGRLSITTIEYPLHRVCGKKPG
jgi:hypothetical protein